MAQTQALSVIDQFRRDLDRMGPQFAHALPAHIPVERFARVVMTAIQNTPTLLRCTRQSLFNACMKAASDGLLPDGREGAIVPFGESEDGGKKSDVAGWMPMIAGIRKKARNSGEITDLSAHVVYEGDVFDIAFGDDPHVTHVPSASGGRTRKIIGAYSIATFKNGAKSYDWMPVEEIEEIRKHYSRSRRGPWSDPIAYPEMCVKTVVKRHCKSLPTSSDLDTVLRRDDELYDFKGARERGNEVTRRAPPQNALAALEQFANPRTENPGPPSAPPDMPDVPPADLADPRPGDDVMIEAAPSTPSGGEPSAAEAVASLINNAAKHPPQNVEEFRLLVHAMIELTSAEADAIDLMKIWWASPAGRTMRNKAQMTSEDTAAIAAEIKSAIGGPAEQNK